MHQEKQNFSEKNSQHKEMVTEFTSVLIAHVSIIHEDKHSHGWIFVTCIFFLTTVYLPLKFIVLEGLVC